MLYHYYYNSPSSIIKSLNKKSFNVKDLESIGAIRIESMKKRTRHTYNIENLVKETHL